MIFQLLKVVEVTIWFVFCRFAGLALSRISKLHISEGCFCVASWPSLCSPEIMEVYFCRYLHTRLPTHFPTPFFHEASLPMFQGDLVIIGSDGVFDNLFKDEAFLENELRGGRLLIVFPIRCQQFSSQFVVTRGWWRMKIWLDIMIPWEFWLGWSTCRCHTWNLWQFYYIQMRLVYTVCLMERKETSPAHDGSYRFEQNAEHICLN